VEKSAPWKGSLNSIQFDKLNFHKVEPFFVSV